MQHYAASSPARPPTSCPVLRLIITSGISPRRPRKYKCNTVDVKALKTIVYSVIGETTIRIRLSLAKTSLRLAKNMHHAVPLSVADLGGGGGRGVATHPLESNFSFLFYPTSTQPSTQPPTPFTTPSLSVPPPAPN